MQMHRSCGHAARALAIAAALAAAVPVQAQVEEIIVTAQRREQNLQEVPVAVSAFSADQITNLQIDVVKDIGENVPNLQTYTVTAGGQAIQVHARGASVQNPGFNLAESPVGIYLDEVYFGRLASVNLELADIERIEALRGPQGTLYGRNTIAGAINIVTRTPGDESWIQGSVGYGNYGTSEVTGSFGGPIEEGSLAGSLSFIYSNRDRGWQNNPTTGEDPGEYENKAARAKLHWYGSSKFDAVLAGWVADVTNDGYNGVPYIPFANLTPNGAFEPAPANSAPLGDSYQGGDFYSNFSSAGVNYGESQQGGGSLTMSYEFDAATLRSITGFASIDDKFGFDLAGGGFPVDLNSDGSPEFYADGLLIRSDSSFDQWSQEFQLLGTAFDDRLNWIFGLFYLHEDGDQQFSGTIVAPPPGFDENIKNTTDSYAAYGQGTWRFNDQWSVQAGLRWSRDEKKYSDDCVGAFCFSDTSFPPTASVSLDDEWDDVTGRLGLEYQINPDQLAYLTFSQGFQAGGFPTLCFGNLSSTCGASTFDPQTVDSYELGWKSDLFDRRLRLNLAAFYADYQDLQSIVIQPINFDTDPEPELTSFPIQNVGDVAVYGVELELTWVPVEGINVFAIAGWQESDFGNVSPQSPPGGLAPPPGVDPNTVCPFRPDPASRACAAPAKELASNPAWQVKVGFDNTIPIPEDLAFFYGLDLFYSDDYFSESRNLIQIDSYTRLNGFVGFGQADRTWQVTLAAKNILNSEDNVSGIFSEGFTNIRTPLPPLEYMLTLSVNY